MEYYIFEWEDETSFFDPKGKWIEGNDYPIGKYKASIPVDIKNEEDVFGYIDNNLSCYLD